MRLEKEILTQLLPVIASARRELAQMDSNDVPGKLKQIAKRSDRTLPPPFARAVVGALEADRDLRAAVSERLLEEGCEDELLIAYLKDPESAHGDLQERAARLRGRDTQDVLARAQQQIAALEGRLAKGRKRVIEVRAAHEKAMRSAVVGGAREKARSEGRIRELIATVALQEERIAEFAAEILTLEKRVDDAESREHRATERARKKLRSGESELHIRERQSDSPSDPLELAEWLDAAERRARPFRHQTLSGVEQGESAPLAIPHGVAPDFPEALASLIKQMPRRVIIDGYNVAGVLHGTDFSTRESRDDVIRRANRLSRATTADVIVVFDSTEEEGRMGFRSLDGVSVRFSRGETADDEIVALVRADPARTVVVTNDRELRTRCALDDCVTIWSTAFV